MKTKSRSVFLILILLLMVFAAGMSLGFGHYEATLAPLLLSTTIFILGAIELVRELRSKDKTSRSAEEEDLHPTVVAEAEGGSETRRFGIALAWIGGFALGIYVLGFFLSTLLFAVSYLMARGRGLLLSAAFAASFTALLYVIFEMGFRSQLYRGLIFGG